MQQNAGQAQAMPETEAVPAGKRPGARNERLNVRDFVTIAVLTVLELVGYFSIGMIAGSTAGVSRWASRPSRWASSSC